MDRDLDRGVALLTFMFVLAIIGCLAVGLGSVVPKFQAEAAASSQYLSETVDKTTELRSVTFASDGKADGSGVYTVVDSNGNRASYSTKLKDFEVVYQQEGTQRLEKVTVVDDGVFIFQQTKQITRLYVTQPKGE